MSREVTRTYLKLFPRLRSLSSPNRVVEKTKERCKLPVTHVSLSWAYTGV